MITITIKDYLKRRGYTADYDIYLSHIDMWYQWYCGDVKKFHNYKVYNGVSRIDCKRHTLNMAKKVCEDWADLLMNEKVTININDKATEEFVNKIWGNNNFWAKINEMQEYKSAMGTVAYVPYIRGANLIGENIATNGGVIEGGELIIDYITADNIYPLSWENGKITECAFASTKFDKNNVYVYLQMHTIEGGNYVIENILFKQDNDLLIQVGDITDVTGFEDVANKIYTNSDKRQFIIDRPNVANTVNRNSPYGMSVFASAIDVLKGIDLVYDSYNNEFELGKKRIMVRSETLKLIDDEPAFDPNDLVFYQLPNDIEDDKFIKEIDMTIRADEHETALQNRLNLLSAKCGFGENHYQFDRGNITTATQVISENSTLFRTLKKHEIILEDVLIELTKTIIRLGITVLKQPLKEDAEITISFDDSIIEDTAQIKAQATMEFQSGIIDAVEYFVKVYKLTEEEAIEKVNKMNARKPKEDNESKDWFDEK